MTLTFSTSFSTSSWTSSMTSPTSFSMFSSTSFSIISSMSSSMSFSMFSSTTFSIFSRRLSRCRVFSFRLFRRYFDCRAFRLCFCHLDYSKKKTAKPFYRLFLFLFMHRYFSEHDECVSVVLLGRWLAEHLLRVRSCYYLQHRRFRQYRKT